MSLLRTRTQARALPFLNSGLYPLRSRPLPHIPPLPRHAVALSTPRSFSSLRLQLTRPHPTSITSTSLHRPLSTTTKVWLYRELILCCKVVAFGSLFLAFAGAATFLGLHFLIERESPTPSIFSFLTRTALHSSHHAAEWEGNHASAAGYLFEAIGRVEADVESRGGWAAVGKEWKREYVKLLAQLGEWEASLGYPKKAALRWRTLLGMEGPEEGVDLRLRIKAAVKLAGLINEVGTLDDDDDDDGPEDVLALQRCKDKNEKDAEELFKLAYTLALQSAPHLPPSTISAALKTPGVIPSDLPTPPPPDLLMTATELGIHYARLHNLALALQIFTSLLRARTSNPNPSPGDMDRGGLSDPCEIGKIMTYLGEVLWAAGDREKGLGWSKRAVETAGGHVEARAACRDCAILAAGNQITMLGMLIGEAADRGVKEGKGWGLWKRGNARETGYEELQAELEAVEERLREFLGIRIVKGK